MVRVKWELPRWPTDMIEEWQKIANLGYVDDLMSEANK
jgi:hypothetical protein